MSDCRSLAACLIVGGVILGYGVQSKAAVVFQDSFEDTSVVPGLPDAPQVGSYPLDATVDPESQVILAGAGIDPASPDAGQNILKIVGKQRNYADPTVVASTGDTITYEFDANHSFSEFTFGFAGDQGGISLDANLFPVWLRVTESDIYYYNAGWISTGITPVLDTWMHIAITYTVGDSTFDLAVDTNSATGLSLTTATAPTEINRVKIMSGGANNTVSYLDNPVVTIDSVGGLAGDLNGDGFVGIEDLNIVLGNWNANVTSGDQLSGDPSGDGFVGIEDLNQVLGNWNAGAPPAASVVPEPASLGLLVSGLTLLARRSR
ncbi:MAG: hypothetical protein R3C45_08420 [Phycisphaerales bacterium]